MSEPAPGAELLAAVEVVDRLRSPGGCPWDARQTHASLARYLLEETYETLEAIDTGDPVALREELGDVLFQVLFHARVASETPAEQGGFDVDDVARDLAAKLTRRHPHVFGDATGEPGATGGPAVTAEDVAANWEALKAAEKGRRSVTDGVPAGQPALAWVTALTDRAARSELTRAVEAPRPEPGDAAGALGRLLFDLAQGAAATGIDPEAALRRYTQTYVAALQQAETGAAAAADNPS